MYLAFLEPADSLVVIGQDEIVIATLSLEVRVDPGELSLDAVQRGAITVGNRLSVLS